MSFFMKKKPKEAFKRQKNGKITKKQGKKPRLEDEEIDSDEVVDSAEGSADEEESDVDEETPQDKRLRLAKKYLDEIAKEEESRAEEKEFQDRVGTRLQEDYLESVGKLRKTIAHLYKGYKESTVTVLRNKKLKLSVTCIVVSSDDKFMLTGCKTSFVLKWDLATLKCIGNFDLNLKDTKDPADAPDLSSPHAVAMCLSTDMKYLAVASGGKQIQIWCPKELKHLKTFKGHMDVVTCLVFRKNSHQLFSGSKDRSVKVWSVDEMAYIESLFGHQSFITGIDALHRERAITSGGRDCSVRIWKIIEESQLIYLGHTGTIEDVKLINEENFISSGDDGSLCTWTTTRKKPNFVKPFAHGKTSNGEPNWISSIGTLVNTDLLASGSSDGFVRVWKMVENGRKIEKLFEIPVKGFVNSLTFTNDAKRLIIGVGQEHRLGRWWRIKEARNSVVVVELSMKEEEYQK